jgi:hypothetical protein
LFVCSEPQDCQGTRPHARFHVVWQILSYAGVGIVALYLLWIDGPAPAERLYLTAALSVAIYGGFFAAVLASPIYGGANEQPGPDRRARSRAEGQPHSALKSSLDATR